MTPPSTTTCWSFTPITESSCSSPRVCTGGSDRCRLGCSARRRRTGAVTIPRIDPFTYARDVSKREVAERLKEVPLFRDCSSRQLRRIAGRGWERDYPAGSALCEEGRLGDDFFIILQGQAEVTRKREKVRNLGPGEHFGEIALLKLIGRAPRSATVTARTPVRCFLLPKGAFRDVIYEANIATNLLYGLAAYMRDPF